MTGSSDGRMGGVYRPVEAADEAVRIEIAALVGLDLTVLRDRFSELYKIKPPVRMSRELMVQAIACRLQERASAGLSKQMKAKLASAAGGMTDGTRRARWPSHPKRQYRIKPGTRLLRRWQGETHDHRSTTRRTSSTARLV